ncbi:MAG: type II secretion system protein [Phycisphaeraceae bacterium]
MMHTSPLTNTNTNTIGRARAASRGFTLIETTIAVLIISVMYAAVLNTLGSARKGELLVTARQKGLELAKHLMGEIVQQAYWDPEGKAGMGPGADENNGTRSPFDDVDDYAGWTESPPTYKNGTAMPGFTGWTRKVLVTWVSTTSPKTTVGSESGLKSIEVIVEFNGKTVATLTALRANVD